MEQPDDRVELSFPDDATAASVARSNHEGDAVALADAVFVDDATLVVSELVGNWRAPRLAALPVGGGATPAAASRGSA